MLEQEIAHLMGPLMWIVLGYLAIGTLLITLYLIGKETIGRKNLKRSLRDLGDRAFLIISILLASFMVDTSQPFLFVIQATGLLILWTGGTLLALWIVR